MKSIKTFKKFGKLCFLAFDFAAVEDYRKQTGSRHRIEEMAEIQESVVMIREMNDKAIAKSGLDIKNYGERRLIGEVESSVRHGQKVLTIQDSPFWEMDDTEFDAFMERLEGLQITEFVYESRDSSAYETFHRLTERGWKMAGLARRLKCSGQFKKKEGMPVVYNDYEYGVKFKKIRKNSEK